MTPKKARKLLRKYSTQIHRHPVPGWLDRLWRKATSAILSEEVRDYGNDQRVAG